MPHFTYGETEIAYLKRRDKKLKLAIDTIGKIEREVTPDLFAALIKTIVGQQISNKAAATVWRRLIDLYAQLSPESIIKTDNLVLQQCGLSLRKVNYIKGIASNVVSGNLDLQQLWHLPDEEIIKRLSALNGIGIWSAEMLLLFAMSRPDVVSFGDLAIRRGMMHLYDLPSLSKEQFTIYRERYSPFGSVASLYLWALSVPGQK